MSREENLQDKRQDNSFVATTIRRIEENENEDDWSKNLEIQIDAYNKRLPVGAWLKFTEAFNKKFNERKEKHIIKDMVKRAKKERLNNTKKINKQQHQKNKHCCCKTPLH